MRKMSRNSLIGLLVAGAAAISGAVCALREKPLENGWQKCEFYIESPRYAKFIQEAFDEFPIGIDGQKEEYYESKRVYCLDWKEPFEENWHHSCYFNLISANEINKGYNVELSEELITLDAFKFSKLNISGFENNPERLNQIVQNSPWIFEAAQTGGYTVNIIKDKDERIIERDYKLANGKEIIAKDSDKDGILDIYKEINKQY